MTMLDIFLFRDVEASSGGKIKNSHIATRITEPESGEEYYFSWGINLQVSFESELKRYEQSKSNSMLLYEKLSIPINKKLSEIKSDIQNSKYIKGNSNFKEYETLQNNCASCTLDIIKFCGLSQIDKYFNFFNDIMFHYPETVFEKAYKMTKEENIEQCSLTLHKI